MAKFTRATTPDITLTIEGFDGRGYDAYVTISQTPSKVITLTGDRLTVSAEESEGETTTTIIFRMTQTETLYFSRGFADVQVRFINAQGEAPATEVGKIAIDPILYEAVLQKGDGS